MLYLRKSHLAEIRKYHEEGQDWIESALKLPLPFFHADYITGMKNDMTGCLEGLTATEAVKNLIKGTFGHYLGNDKAKLMSSWAEDLDLPSVPALLTKADELAEQVKAMRESKVKAKGDSLQLMTIHASKGLEFRAVFLVGAYDGTLPSGRDDADLSEERRLLYVAVTRAKERLYISYPEHTMESEEEHSASRFLREAFFVA